MGRTIFEARRQCAADGIARAIGQLRLQDARRARADAHTHTPAAPPLGRLLHGLEKLVLLQGQLGQPFSGSCCSSTPATSPIWVSMSTVSNSHRFNPLRCSNRLCKVAVRPLPMQLVAVNLLSSSGLMAGRIAG